MNLGCHRFGKSSIIRCKKGKPGNVSAALIANSCAMIENETNTITLGTKQLVEGSLEVKLPTIWTDEKQRWEESEKRREKERESQKKEDSGARKGSKVEKHCVFVMV